MASPLTRLGARLVHSTTLVDRAYLRFERLRSLIVLAFASESFLEAHSKLAYGAATAYRADSALFRSGLFPWEQAAIREWFPAPPARILLGGAGGGREAYPLIEMGYDVVAFEPAPALAATMAERGRAEFPNLKVYCAGYEDLPMVSTTAVAASVDLRDAAPFEAAILGWCSFSHLMSDSARVAALENVAALTNGPILVSCFPERGGPFIAPSGRGLFKALKRRALRRGPSIFTTSIGYARLLSEDELKELVDRAGLQITHTMWQTEWPHVVVHRRR
jgi:hypothetical protein